MGKNMTFKLSDKEKNDIEQKLEKSTRNIHRNSLKNKKIKTKTTDNQLEKDFSNFCTKLSEVLYLKGLKKIKYLTLIPEIIYYFVRCAIGVITFINNYEPLTILFSSIRELSKDERQEVIDNIKAHACRENCKNCKCGKEEEK